MKSKLFAAVVFLSVTGFLFWRASEQPDASYDAKVTAIKPSAPPSVTPVPAPRAQQQSPPAGIAANVRNARPGRWLDFVASITPEETASYLAKSDRRVVLSQMPGIMARYHVPADKTKDLEVLLVARQSLSTDLAALQKRYPDEEFATAAEAFRIAEQRRIDSEIARMIGRENMENLSEEVNRFRARAYVAEFLGEAYARGTPISRDKENKLSALLKAAANRGWHARPNALPDLDTGLNAFDLEALTLLATELTPPQLELLRQLKSESRAYALAREVDSSPEAGFASDP